MPADPARRDERCREAYDIQIQGLAQRLRATGIGKAVIGVSGGLDSAQALLVTAKAFDELGLPRGSIPGFNLPGFASSRGTQDSAHRLMAGSSLSRRRPEAPRRRTPAPLRRCMRASRETS
ncbi:hypothetical protein [Inquilinus sp. OTU3971]|uniref:hypothetical protein n=1 Tax=Inquilinus sp. OTU3971 TaxID=3043855 RepID=UPI00313B1E9D